MSNSRQIKIFRKNPLLWGVLLLTICLASILLWTVLQIPRPLPGLGREAANNLALSGVDNPVTAVLLNFRGYDTLLEIIVFLLGAITVWSITHAPFPATVPDTSPVQMAAVRLLAPLACLIAGYLVWQGATQTGGAFQAGAVLSAGLVLLLISDLLWVQRMRSLPLRIGMTMGPLLFIILALWGTISDDVLLKFAPQHASGFLLFLEAGCAISIGLILAAFFAGGRPPADLREEPYVPGQNEGEG